MSSTHDRASRTRARLAEILRRLAEHPDDEDLQAQADRLREVVRCHEFTAMVHRATARWYLYQDSVARRN